MPCPRPHSPPPALLYPIDMYLPTATAARCPIPHTCCHCPLSYLLPHMPTCLPLPTCPPPPLHRWRNIVKRRAWRSVAAYQAPLDVISTGACHREESRHQHARAPSGAMARGVKTTLRRAVGHMTPFTRGGEIMKIQYEGLRKSQAWA